MDRGRVGYAAVGNKQLRENTIKHVRDVHLARVKAIKTRKPGTSDTLDNTAPHVIAALKSNPRKIGKSRELNVMIERENKSLLKRISKILTAPPKINDDDYVRMRALCPSMKGPKEIYEEQIILKHHKQLMKHLKGTGPFYDRKKWEESYKAQKIHQRFMREVTYKRPPGFVDPLAPTDKPRNLEKERRAIIERRKMAKEISGPPGSQVKRVQSVRDSKDGSRSGSAGDGMPPSRERTPSRGSMRNGRPGSQGNGAPYGRGSVPGDSSLESGTGDWGGLWAEEDDAYSGGAFGAGGSATGSLSGSSGGRDRTFTGVELAEIERMVQVDDDNEEFAGAKYETQSVVKCTVVEQESLLIMVRSKQEPSLTSVAEVQIGQIAELKGLDADSLRTDADMLSELSIDLANCVEFKIESGVPRLQLSLEDMKQETPRPPMPEYDREAEESVLAQSTQLEPPYETSLDVICTFKTKEMFESDTCPKPRPERLVADVVVRRETEETASISVTMKAGSKFKYNGTPAISSGTVLTLTTYLPSIARADLDLAREFYENIALDVKILHNNVTGVNALTLPEVERPDEGDKKKK